MKNFISLSIAAGLLPISNLSANTLFVSRESKNPVAPFANWATAATNIQQAVNAAAAGDVVLITNGIYGAITVDKPLSLRSVNGAKVTVIDAARRGRCAYLTNGTSLAGFMLRQGLADVFGGGVFCASSDVFLTNCVITENEVGTNANGSVLGSGGGVYGGRLYNCLVTRNKAAVFGGGAFGSTLYNCTVIGNRADKQGGGVYSSAVTNSIIYYNTSAPPHANQALAQLDHCCTTPLPTTGIGNITNEPVFADYSRADLRQLGTSRCIDAGDNSVVATPTDLAGNPRIVRGTVDMGAYEFPGTNALEFYAWVQHHGVPIDGTADYEDPDGDGMNNWEEWVCYTCPTNSLLNLRLVSAVPAGRDVVVRWKSTAGVIYLLERNTNATPPFTVVATSLRAPSSEFVYTDKNVPGPGPFFYRVGVKPRPPTSGPTVYSPILSTQERQTAGRP